MRRWSAGTARSSRRHGHDRHECPGRLPAGAGRPRALAAAARLLRLELRHNAMLWMLPVAVALFWLTTYRKTMAMPPLWNLRAAGLQTGAMLAFA